MSERPSEPDRRTGGDGSHAEPEPGVIRRDRDDPASELVLPIRDLFAHDPGVGFSVVDLDGVIRFVNRRSARLFNDSDKPGELVGRSLVELYGDAWAQERIETFRDILRTGRPVIMRHIRNGRQLQSTVRLISDTDAHACGDRACFSIVTVEGEHDPGTDEDFEIVESDLVHLGPLDPLSHRELEVLALIGHGLSSTQIAEALFRSTRTVEQHCSSIRKKLDAASRIEMANYAQRAGLTLADAERERVH